MPHHTSFSKLWRSKKTVNGDLEEKFNEKTWNGLELHEKIRLTQILDKKYPGLVKLDEELQKLEKFPETRFPAVVAAESNRNSFLKGKDESLLFGLHTAFRKFGKLIVPLGLTKEEVAEAIEGYENSRS